MTEKEINETLQSMPDFNQYLDDEHEKLDEALAEWISGNYYTVRCALELAHKQSLGAIK